MQEHCHHEWMLDVLSELARYSASQGLGPCTDALTKASRHIAAVLSTAVFEVDPTLEDLKQASKEKQRILLYINESSGPN